MKKAPDNALREDLLNAIKLNQFILHYQPQYNLTNTAIEGVEALIRWQHPTRGLLLPHDFIAEAESGNVIQVIGEWVLKTACIQNKAWQEKGLPPIRMAVNVTERQLKQKNFVEFVLGVLNKIRLKPYYLELEINENTMIADDDKKIIRTIKRLKKLGVQLALDDFGTGYTSVKYLQQFPLDRIKIDKTYIENISTNPDDAAILKAMIDLAHSMNLQVIVEGVESMKQLQMIAPDQGIEVQGFYFSEALPADKIERLLLDQN